VFFLLEIDTVILILYLVIEMFLYRGICALIISRFAVMSNGESLIVKNVEGYILIASLYK
jgi:hypothetical protein